MVIAYNLSALMGQHRMNIQDVCNKTGLSRNTAAFLYHDKAKAVNFETLAKICELLDCNVGGILEVDKNKEWKYNENKKIF